MSSHSQPTEDPSGQRSESTTTPAQMPQGGQNNEPTAGKVSTQRSHKGNVPYLPQTKLCHLCPAKFTRQTHLNRHLKTHTGERLHHCDKCDAKFTRSDLLTRHKRICSFSESGVRTRKRACQTCAESKVRCDGQQPCAKCRARGRECIQKPDHASTATEVAAGPVQENGPYTAPTAAPTASGSAPSYGAADSDLLASFDLSDFTGFDGLPPFAPAAESSACMSFEAAPVQQAATLTAGPSTVPSGSSLGSSEHSTPSELSLFSPTFGQKTHLEELFAGDTFDSLLTGIFDTNFHNPPELPGQYFQYDPINVLEDRFGSALLGDAINPRWPMGLEPPPHCPSSEVGYGEDEPEVTFLWPLGGTPPAPETNSFESEFSSADLQLFLSKFFTTFSVHVPIVHTATIDISRQMPVLFRAMRACGAMYVQTPSAKRYVDLALKTVRDELVAKFASGPTDHEVITQLLQAYVMVQTMGLSHKLPEQRARATVYHGIITMMLRTSGFHARVSKYKPGYIDFTDPLAVHAEWRQWVQQEAAVRAIWVCQAQDSTHCMDFNVLPATYKHSCGVPLPSEEALWNASSGEEWAAILQQPSPYGTIEQRLVGVRLPALYEYLIAGNTQLAPRTVILNPFAQTLYLHAVLIKLHEHYLRDRMPNADAGADASLWARTQLKPHAVNQQRTFILQLQLHYWFTSWQLSPAPAPVSGKLPYMLNPLPFYWLAQVCVLAYQEGLPPFDADGTYITSATAKFELLKRWERHIREFLANGEERPATEFWESVMMSRLDAFQAETGWKPSGDFDHLLGFYVSRL